MIKKAFYITIIIAVLSLTASCACPPDAIKSKCNESAPVKTEETTPPPPPAAISPTEETASLPEFENSDPEKENAISLPAYQRWLRGGR